MNRITQITLFGFAGLVLAGCNSGGKDEPIWEQAKITDLAPATDAKDATGKLLKTINFNIFIFDIPAEKTSTLDGIWQVLYRKPLQFKDYDAFAANSFAVGFGQLDMWNTIADMLRDAGGERAEKISVLLTDDRPDDIVIGRLGRRRTIFHTPKSGSTEATTAGPGKIALRIKAQKIPGQRGVCNVDVVPVFSPPISTSIPQLADREKAGEIVFTSCRLRAKMSPGDFVLLGPQKHISRQVTLAGLLFSRSRRKPIVRTYLFVCTRIVD
ncbi:MAG: hypothetical protein JSV99_09580 [Planctomycetota bacterium]|nr:MAG: hypothetical protein JSV99_09580 [Planctomycetota bacterium]